MGTLLLPDKSQSIVSGLVFMESGWDRFGSWQKFNSERWTGFGVRPSIEIGSTDVGLGNMSIRAYYLQYNMSFGEMDGWGFSLGWEF